MAKMLISCVILTQAPYTDNIQVFQISRNFDVVNLTIIELPHRVHVISFNRQIVVNIAERYQYLYIGGFVRLITDSCSHNHKNEATNSFTNAPPTRRDITRTFNLSAPFI